MTSEAVEAICYARFPRFRCRRRALQLAFYSSETAPDMLTHEIPRIIWTRGRAKCQLSCRVRTASSDILKCESTVKTNRLRVEFLRTHLGVNSSSQWDRDKFIAVENHVDIEITVSDAVFKYFVFLSLVTCY